MRLAPEGIGCLRPAGAGERLPATFTKRENELTSLGSRRSTTAEVGRPRPQSPTITKRFVMAAHVQLRIAVSDPGLAQSLSGFLEHSIYRPTAEGGVVSVTGPDGLSLDVALEEIRRFVEAWGRLHPEASPRLID
jgi:hypothetical protein